MELKETPIWSVPKGGIVIYRSLSSYIILLKTGKISRSIDEWYEVEVIYSTFTKDLCNGKMFYLPERGNVVYTGINLKLGEEDGDRG